MVTGLARPRESTPAEQLVETANSLLKENSEAIQAIMAEGMNLFGRAQDPQRTFLPQTNPFTSAVRSAEGVDTEAMNFSNVWKLREVPLQPDSAQELMMATFAPGIGSIDKVATVLAKAEYPRSLAALSVIEEGLKEIFVTTKKEAGLVPKTIERGVSNLRQLIAFLLLRAAGWAAKSPEMVAAGTRAMISSSSPLLLTDDSEAPRYADAPMEYPSKETKLLQNIMVGKPRSKKDTIALIELHRKLKELTPLFAAFRILLADEIREKEAREGAVEGAENVFKPLTTKPGLILALSQAVGLTTSSIFGILPHILDQNIDNLTEIDGLNRDRLKLEDVNSMGNLSCRTPAITHQYYAKFELIIGPGNVLTLQATERSCPSDELHRDLDIWSLGQAKMAGIYGETIQCIKGAHGLLVYTYRQYTCWITQEGRVFQKSVKIDNHNRAYGGRVAGPMRLPPDDMYCREIGMLAADYEQVQVYPLTEKIEVGIGGKCYAVSPSRPSEQIF